MMENSEPKFLHSMSVPDLQEWLKGQKEPSFRAKQILEWLWKRQESDITKMSNIGLSLREKLLAEFVAAPLQLTRKEESGETSKFLWRLYDGKSVESVLIKAPNRCTVCVSTQVGCPVRCAFCASGKKGFFRNLYAAEIVCQVLEIQKILAMSGEKVTNIVYMGMGEPLENYDNVVASIRMLTDPDLFGISRRRITVSTVGIVENILRLAKDNLGVNLALSLHAPTQEQRQRLIPYARKYALEDVLAAVQEYQLSTGRDITYEYILIADVNDRFEDAEHLVALLRGHQGSINLIPYNPVADMQFKRPSASKIAAFRAHLDNCGVVHTCRYTKGDDIAAACGQLVLQGEGDAI
jgi:23S rRNA (adenine2503-C2)-methyltransferase